MGSWSWVTNLVFEHVLGIIWISRGSHDIIDNNVDHEVPGVRQLLGFKGYRKWDSHVSPVKLSRESFEVISGTEAGVQLSRVLDPVAFWM